jgi:hypothetical protein
MLLVSLALFAFAGWRAIGLGIANFDAVAAPTASLGWRPDFAEAELNFTEGRFKGRQSPTGGDSQIRHAIHSAPLQGRGFRLLAREAELRGQARQAEALYAIAAARAPRDLPSQAWMARRELVTAAYAKALSRFDYMMRVQPEIGLRLAPVLLAVAVHAPARADFAHLLLRRPPWREDFMPRLVTQTSTASVFPLMEMMRREPGGLDDSELRLWLDRLTVERQWGTAYLSWVQSLTPEGSLRIGNIYNGSFELEPRNLGFDWRFEPVAGARMSRVQVTGAKENLALRVEFDGSRIDFHHVRQLMALAPGEYRFLGRVRLDDLRSERGLVWTVSCAEDGKVIAETEPMSGRHDWRQFELMLRVPVENCGGQWLTLRVPARIEAERRIGGIAWFDDLRMKGS